MDGGVGAHLRDARRDRETPTTVMNAADRSSARTTSMVSSGTTARAVSRMALDQAVPMAHRQALIAA